MMQKKRVQKAWAGCGRMMGLLVRTGEAGAGRGGRWADNLDRIGEGVGNATNFFFVAGFCFWVDWVAHCGFSRNEFLREM